jgi:hypothetical protein
VCIDGYISKKIEARMNGYIEQIIKRIDNMSEKIEVCMNRYVKRIIELLNGYVSE